MAATSEIGIKIGLQGAEQVRTQLGSVGQALGGLGDKAGTLRDQLSAVAPQLAALFSVGGIAAFVKASIDAIDKLNDIADATGSTVEEISKLEKVGKLTGTGIETISTALVKFNAALKEAKPDSGAALALKVIGVEADKLRQLDPSVALRQTALALANFADDGNKARIAQELFGKSLREVAPFLKDLAEQGEQVASVTTEQAEAAERFNKQLFALQANSAEAARKLGIELLPTLNQIAEEFSKSANNGGVAAVAIDGIRIALEAIVITGANVAFVLQAAGREIGAVAARAVALASLDFKGFRAIGDAVKEDAARARKELDDFEQRILNARQNSAAEAAAKAAADEASNAAAKKRLDDITKLQESIRLARESQSIAEQIYATILKRRDTVATELQLGRALTEAEKFSLEINEAIGKAKEKLLPADRARLEAELRGAAALVALGEQRKKQLAADLEFDRQRQEANDQIAAELVKQTDAYAAAAEANYQLSVNTKNTAEQTDLELRLLGAGNTERARALGLLQAQQAIRAKDIELARNLNLTEEQRSEILAKFSKATLAGVEDGVKRAALDDARNTFNQVSQSLSDALLNGGKSAGEALKRYFKTLILQPIIKAIVDPVALAVTGSLGLGSSAALASQASGGASLGIGSALVNLLNGSTISNAVGNAFIKFGTSDFGARLGLSSATDFGTGYTANAITSTGSTIGTALGYGGNALAGVGISNLISNGYKIGDGQLVSAVTAVASTVFGPIAGVVAGIVNRLFGRKLADVGIEGSFSSAGFDGNSYQFYQGGLFRSDKTERMPVNAALDRTLDAAIQNINTQLIGLAQAMVQPTDALRNFRQEIKVSFQGLNEQQIQDKIKEVIGTYQDSLAQAFIDSLDRSTLQRFERRLLDNLDGTATEKLKAVAEFPAEILKSFGLTRKALISTFVQGLAQADATAAGQAVADQLVSGIEASILSNATGQIFDIVNRGIVAPMLDALVTGQKISEVLSSEAIAQTIARAQAQAQALAALFNNADFRAAIEQIRTTTAGAFAQVGSVLVTVPTLTTVSRPIQQVTTAVADLGTTASATADQVERITRSLKDDLFSAENELLRVQGNAAEATARERAKAIEGYNDEQVALYDSVAAIRLRTQALRTQAELESQVASALPGVIDKFLTPDQRTVAAYQRISADLAKAGISVTAEALTSVTKQQFAAAAATIFTLGATTDETRLVILRAAGAFADLKDAAEQSNRAVLQAAVTEANQAVTTAETNLREAFNRVLANRQQAEADLRAAFERESSTLQATRDRFRDLGKTLREFADTLFDSTRTSTEGLSLLRARFTEVSTLAKGGDEASLRALPQLGRQLADATLAGAATREDALRELARINEAVLQSADSADVAATVAEDQLAQLRLQVSRLISIDSGVLSVSQAITNLQTASEAEALAREQIGSLITLNESTLSVRDAVTALSIARTTQANANSALALATPGSAQRAAIIQREATAAYAGVGQNGTTYEDAQRLVYQAAVRTGVSSGELAAATGVSQAEILQAVRALGLPAFANGGRYMGGLALVGEQGPELIAFSAPGQVYSAPQTSALLDTSALLAELQRLNDEVQALRAEARATAVHTSKTADVLYRATDGGNDYLQTKVAA